MGNFKLALRSNYIALTLYLLLLLFLTIFVANASHVFFSSLDPDKSEFDRWEKALQVAISVTGFLSLLVTVKIWQDSDKRQVNQAALSLFEKFRDEQFIALRRRAWLVRNKWYLEEGYRDSMISYVYDDKNFYVPYDDNLYMKEFVDIRALFEFYAVLTNYNGSENIIKSCRYFYYGWWRHFLYEVAEMHDYYYRPTLQFSESYPKAYRRYQDNMTYLQTLKKLDAMVGFEKIPCNVVIHDFN